MRKVELRMNEQEKYDVIKRVANNEISVSRASILLRCTTRSIYNLVKVYKEKGKVGFVHGNRDRKPSITKSDELKEKILNLFKSDSYEGVNFNHFLELLKRENINVSYNFLYKLLKNEGYISPKCNKNTRREHNKKLKSKIENKEKLKEAEQEYIAITNLDDLNNSHPRKPRAKYSGEIVQMDASVYIWFGNIKLYLHIAIDDATGAILGAYFDRQETLNGYYQVFYQILTNYGIPAEFLTDRRTVFEYKSLKKPSDEKDTFTQFSYACSQLGVNITTSSVPQVKGRVERLFNTLQSRLPVEMRLAKIKTIDEANEFLTSYINEFNNNFSIINYYTKSVFDKQIDSKKINYTLSIISRRVVDKGNSIKYKRKTYQFYDKNGLACVKPKTQCLVIKTFDNKLLACIGKDLYELIELPNNQKVSKTFDKKEIKEHKYKGHRPSWFHPWGYYQYQAKIQRHKKKAV